MVARPLPWLVICSLSLGLGLGCGDKPAPKPPLAPSLAAPDSATPLATTPLPELSSSSALTTTTFPLNNTESTSPLLAPAAAADLPTSPSLIDSITSATLPAGDDQSTTDSDTSSAGTTPDIPSKLANANKRIVVADAKIIESLPRETLIADAGKNSGKNAAAKSDKAKGKAPCETMTLRAYLTQELGSKKFHIRSRWAGGGYEPIVVGKRVWKSLGDVNYVTIHHSEGVPEEHPARMIRNIFTGHTTPGGRLNAPDVGYHFFVDRDGEVWEGRDASKLGTHVGSKPSGLNNAGNIGICGLGDFLHEGAPRKMTEGIVNLTVLVAQYYGHSVTVRGHKDWMNINEFHPYGGCDCPGHLMAAVTRARSEVKAAFAKPKAAPLETQLAEQPAKPGDEAVTTAMAK